MERRGDRVRAYIAGVGLDALKKGNRGTVAETVIQLTGSNPDPLPVLVAELAENLGRLGDEALAEVEAAKQRRQSKTG